MAHVAVDDHLAALGDLAELILGVAVDVYFQTVDARAQVIARIVVAIDPQAVGCRAETGAVEPRAAGVVMDDVPPTQMIGLDGQRRIAVFAFGGETAGVDQQRGLVGPAGRGSRSRVCQVIRAMRAAGPSPQIG